MVFIPLVIQSRHKMAPFNGVSSLLISCVGIALLFRVDIETRFPEQASVRVKR